MLSFPTWFPFLGGREGRGWFGFAPALPVLWNGFKRGNDPFLKSSKEPRLASPMPAVNPVTTFLFLPGFEVCAGFYFSWVNFGTSYFLQNRLVLVRSSYVPCAAAHGVV